ncbi:MAG: EcsC family protein [Boseongicola sp.]
MDACEEATTEVRRWALGYAVTGGGAAGAFGALGLALDVPATMTLALRTVRLIGLCYGFGADTEAERVYILDILQLAGANSTEEKAEAIERLAKERTNFDGTDWQKIVQMTGQTSGSLAATQRVAATLGVNLSTRKVAQLAPVIGAAVGASVNAAFLNDVAAAARFAYRERWLQVNEGIIEAATSEQHEGSQ